MGGRGPDLGPGVLTAPHPPEAPLLSAANAPPKAGEGQEEEEEGQEEEGEGQEEEGVTPTPLPPLPDGPSPRQRHVCSSS